MAGQNSSEVSNFSAAEVEFLAEDDVVEIVPNVKMNTLNMICGDFGPFRPQIPTEVPLWLAIAMKKRNKCRLCPPDWMSVDMLTQVLEAERESPQEFSPLPFHYVEVSRLLLDNAREDITDVYLVQSLIEDIKNVRFHKVQAGLTTLKGRTHAVKMKNLSAMEVNLIRPFLVGALERFDKHDSEDMARQRDSQEDSELAAAIDHRPRRIIRPR